MVNDIEVKNGEYALLEAVYPTIEENLNNSANTKKLMTHIAHYADSHSSILLSTDMSERLIFSDKDKEIVFEVSGTNPALIERALKKSTIIKASWRIATNPFYDLCILVAHYYKVHNMKKEMDAIIVYLSYLLYTSSHKGSFKYLPNKECMDYTINNLSNRFLLKQIGTIHGVLEHTVITAIDNKYGKELERCSDADIKDILSALETRISSTVKYIAKEFYANHASGKYLFHEEDSEDADNYHPADNTSFKIDRIATNVASSIITEGFDYNLCIKRAVSLCSGASAKKLEPMLRTIVSDDSKSIKGFIEDLLTLFIYKSSNPVTINDVSTNKFVVESLYIYKSNSKDPIIARVKDKLQYWIDITSEKYGRNFISKGKTSLDTYRKAIYVSFIYKIMETSR